LASRACSGGSSQRCCRWWRWVSASWRC
jgi:hypothetical protein